MRAMHRASADLFGPRFSWEGVEPSGGLDPVLFAEAARRSGHRVEPGHHEAFRSRYVAILEEELAAAGSGARPMPGIPELLDHLRGRDDAVLGLLTGNYGEGAALKLRTVGIDPAWFRIQVFGDDAPTRPGMVAVGLERWGSLSGEAVDPRRAIVIGDTPKDVACARANGCRCLAVATGNFPVEALRAAGADVAVEDLTDPAPLLGLIEKPS